MIKKISLSIISISGFIAAVLFFNVEPQHPFHKYFLPFILANFSSFIGFLIYNRIDMLIKAIKIFFSDSEKLCELMVDIVIFISFFIFIIIPILYLILLYINVDYANLIMHFFTERTVIEPTTEQKLIFWLSAVLLSISYNYISPKDK